MTKVVLWDFDETLAERPGRWWGCLLEIIARRHPDVVPDERALRAGLRGVYPWHTPEVGHEHLNDPDAWWAALQPGLAAAAVAGGLDPPHPRAIALALEPFDDVEVAWMIGNNPRSDIAAADAAGIPSVLVVRDRPAPLTAAAQRVIDTRPG